MGISNLWLGLSVSLAVVALSACSGSSEDSEGAAGAGGKILDSGQTDTEEASTNTDTGTDVVMPETGQDVTTDTVSDVSADQSVTPETSVPDAPVSDGSLFDLTMPDVALNESGATLQGCYDCAVDHCTTEMQACEDDDKCRSILLCLFEDQCFGGPNGLDIGCGWGCASKHGVTSPADPSVGIAMEAGKCISAACGDDCALPEGGI